MRAAFVLWALLAAAVAVRAAPAPVATASGLLQGATIGSANQWLGVPYAQPPVGPLRWKRPQPPLKWSGVRPALAFQNSCVQAVPSSIPQSEDCLYVNIWAPANATSASSLPVMFWIHGGAWEFGSPVDYNAAELAPLYNVIYVTVAYRLGALGFLAEPYLLQQEPLLGALGLADAQAGLQWVQTNIAAFGGDPGRVTVFGESAGSGSVNLLNTMPSAKGLFRNAIGESGVFRYLTVAAAVPQGLALSAALNCSAGSTPDPVACLLAQPAQRVMQVLPVNGDIFIGLLNASYGVGWTPLIDGTYIVGQPINMALKGLVNAQHYILGTNAQEGNGFIIPYFDGKQPSPTEFAFLVNNTFGNAFLQPAYQTYSADFAAGDYVAALADMANDFYFQCQRLLMARAIAAAGVPTYTYLFSYPYTEPGRPDLGAVHGDEVYFVWGAVSLLHMNASEAALSGWMSSAWAAFATHDDPNAAALPVPWPRHNATTEAPIDFDLTLSVLPAPYRANYCPMWLPALLAPVA